MKKTLSELTEDLHAETARLPQSTSQVETEKYFQLTDDFWCQAKAVARETGFKDDKAEIQFFKTIKAIFTGLLEYYILLYRYQGHAGGSVDDLAEFRRKELDRINEFRQTHEAFVRYLEAGRTDWDDVYFLRTNLRRTQRPVSQVYDRAKDLWTNGDWIVTQLEGNRLFEQFLQNA